MSDADARRDAAYEQWRGAWLERLRPKSFPIAEVCWGDVEAAAEAAWAAATADRAAHGRAEFERALGLVEAEATPSRWGWGGTRENVERVRQAEQARRREADHE